MNIASNAVRSEALPGVPEDYASFKPQNVRASSRGLGWSDLNFERRESPPGARNLAAGSNQHLIFISLGSGRIARETGGETVERSYAPGSIAVVPSGTPVAWKWSTRLNCSVLMLEPAFVDQVAHDVFGLRPQDYRLTFAERDHDAVITHIAGVLAREAMVAEPGGRLYAESLRNILAVHLLRHYAAFANGRTLDTHPNVKPEPNAALRSEQAVRPGAPPRAVADAVRFMQENHARDIALQDLADAVHLSPFHVARVFKQALGVSPHQYLIQMRVNSARALLEAGSGDRSLADIATAVGFADQSHLTRHFKKVMGVTPSQYRENASDTKQ